MNVFVLCTGRCGSLTFTRACGHMTNLTTAHESRVALIGDARLAFPDNHIEVDNRLAWFLGRLDQIYGDRAHYVHLTRDPALTAQSWSRRFHVLGGIMPAYRANILSAASIHDPISRPEAAADYVRTVTENIALFLKDKSNVMRFRMEEAETAFPAFWTWIGAEGDLQAAMREWSERHDTEIVRARLRQRVRDFGRRLRWAFFPPA
jgi:hypothetical protein